MNIVIIDDDEAILDVVAIILAKAGYTPLVFSTAEDILKTILKLNPALVLLDVKIGAEDGRVLCKQIKTTKESAHTPVILFSATVNYEGTCEEYLCDDFLAKPFDMDDLVERVSRFTRNFKND